MSQARLITAHHYFIPFGLKLYLLTAVTDFQEFPVLETCLDLQLLFSKGFIDNITIL